MSSLPISFNRYRAKPDRTDELVQLLHTHQSVLREAGFITDRPAETYVGDERETKGPLVVELFEWTSDDAAAKAHAHPEVGAIWATMDSLCEERGGRQKFEFDNLRRPSSD